MEKMKKHITLSFLFSLLILLSFPQGGSTSLSRPSFSFSSIVASVSPAVVNIYAPRALKAPLYMGPFFRFFFGDGFEGPLLKRFEQSLGSGVIVQPNGLMITNYHIIEDSTSINIVLSDGREFDAEIVLKDRHSDLCVLKIKADEIFPYIKLEEPQNLQVGDVVLAIGNPFGLENTVTSGIISALERTRIGRSKYQAYIQTDAGINPGNSGGALVTIHGTLAGLCTLIFSKGGGSDAIGFAIPASKIKDVIEAGITQRPVRHPWTGLAVQPMTKEIAEALGLSRISGVMVGGVYEGSPADKHGIQRGDIITHINSRPIVDDYDFYGRIGSLSLNTHVALNLIRKGKKESIDLTLEAPPEIPSRQTTLIKGNNPLAGIEIENLSPAVALENDLDWHEKGVIITNVAEGTYAQDLGLKEGDQLQKINTIPIHTVKDVLKAVKNKTRHWQLILKRHGKTIALNIRL